MATMRAFVLTGHGGSDKLEYRTDFPKPVPGAGEVLIRVSACGLNNTDINTRTAWYSRGVSGATEDSAPPGAKTEDAAWGGRAIQFPRVQGADVCGFVEEIGDGANRELLGKRVLIDTWLRDWNDPHNLEKTGYFGSECDGGFAEYVKIDARQVHPIDSQMSDVELAAVATAYSTAENMLNRAQVCAEDSVLISGASGGVGTALIQLAKRRGAKTIAMCGEDKHESVRAFGADFVLPRSPENLRARLQTQTGKESATVIADVVGGEYWPNLIDALARGGRYVCSGAIAGAEVRFDLRVLYLRDLAFFGGTVVPPGLFATLVSYIEKGEIRPQIAAQYPLKELHEAQRAFAAKKFVGNIVAVI
ncbi:MAG: alcohol dehydrogenase family protein [Gammaproteobacteria bacterium]